MSRPDTPAGLATGGAPAVRTAERNRRAARQASGRWGTRWRHGVQLVVLAAFLLLLLAARPTPGAEPSWLLKLFFHLDPLILVSAALATWTIEPLAWLALVTVVATILLGRVFCGWLCPLGTLHAIVSRLTRGWRARHAPQRWSRWQLAKYYVLAAMLVLALLGVPWLVLVDPIVILYRTTATAIIPGAQWMIEDGAAAVYQADPAIGDWRLTNLTEPPYRWLRDNVFVTTRQSFLGSGLILAFLLLILTLNVLRPRFWCRYICPLGGLLGLLAWRPWLRRETSAEACNQCDLCGLRCPAAATSTPGAGWKPQECLGCLNCTESCTAAGLKFRFRPPWRAAPLVDGYAGIESIDLRRRELLSAAAAGVVGAVVLRTTPQARGRTFHPDLIRPPGARAEADFLERCTACGLCMKICPTGGLQPTLHQAGLAGLWTPRLVPTIGYCDYECNRCGQVCPTGAIVPTPPAAKQSLRIGLAMFDTSRCLPYALGRNCMVCEEHCPVPRKAIYFREVELPADDGQQPRTVLEPHVDPERCIGCGICEYVCPFKDRPAIRVTSAGESRHPKNQPILPGETPRPRGRRRRGRQQGDGGPP